LHIEFLVKNLAELQKVADWLNKTVSERTLFLLSGSLGTGKTALTKKLLKSFNWPENKVKSPTFSLINRYLTDQWAFYHIDLYRLEKDDPFLLEEIREILNYEKAVIVIEWPEKLNLAPLYEQAGQIIQVKIVLQENNLRKIEIYGNKSANTLPS
jgi:tRNA threonylcarbamoyl adenosine modification protein YjeE